MRAVLVEVGLLYLVCHGIYRTVVCVGVRVYPNSISGFWLDAIART